MAASLEHHALCRALHAACYALGTRHRTEFVAVAMDRQHRAADLRQAMVQAPRGECRIEPHLGPRIQHPRRLVAVPSRESRELLVALELRLGSDDAIQRALLDEC